VCKFADFSYHGNSSWSGTNFTYTVKLADLENSLFGARILIMSRTQADL